MIEGLSLSVIMSAVSVLGLPGLVLIFWYVDQRRYERDRKERMEREAEEQLERLEWDQKRDQQHLAEITLMKEHFAAATTLYDKRFESVVRMYEDNVLLVKGYDRVAGELLGAVALNTQVSTRLAERIDNNLFCPIIKKGGVDGLR